jgi:peptidyl-prolyl cis-trans isomerase D
MGLQKITVPDLIKENDAQVGRDLQEARQLVRWVFDAKKGDISDPFNIGDRFVVAIVDKVMEEGLQDVQTARPKAEAAIRDEKKGEEILKKLGSTPTLESAAAAFAKQVLTAGEDSSIIFTAKIINNIGVEPKVIGACFNKENLTKVSTPIIGKNGVYVLKVNSIGTKAADTPEQLTAKRKQGADQQRNQALSNWFDGLKNQATIKDSRSKFY